MSDREAGQVLPLVLGLTLVSFAVVGLAVDGTRAFLYRRTLQNAADSAALAGAGEVAPGRYYSSGGSDIVLSPSRARSVARDWLGRRGLPIDAQIDAGTDEVRVLLRGTSSTTFLRLIGIEEVSVAAEARASPVAGVVP